MFVDKLVIEPCILVSEKITVDRAVSYRREELLQESHPDGSEDAAWRTDRHYKDRKETKAADRVYSQARAMLRKVCLPTEIGFVCPSSKQADLERTIDDVRVIIQEANKEMQYCNLTFRVVCTSIEPTNEDGASVLRETLQEVSRNITDAFASFNPRRVRDALGATKRLVDVFQDPDARTELYKAREEARKLAGDMTKVLKDYDGNVRNAMASQSGTALLERASAEWNF